MPPPAHLVKKPVRRVLLKRCKWGAIKARFVKACNSYATALNDLSFDDRTHRVRALQWDAYRMGRRDQRDVERARRSR